MSVRLSIAGHTAAVTLAAVLVGAAGGVALADPPALHRNDCAATVAHVNAWPGTTGDGVRLVSDAYVSRLSRSEACLPNPTTR